MKLTISARGKRADQPMADFLQGSYNGVSLDHIDSVFGFVERCTLYGGRPFIGPQLSDPDIAWLAERGIGYRIPMTNHLVTEQEYESYRWLFEKYHHRGNSIIITNDRLAKWVRRDFPLYQLEASVIKEISSHQEIEATLELYDLVILPMKLNNDVDFLKGVTPKDKVTLFANAGCALNCPSKICYPSISRMNKFTGAEFLCSQPHKPREMLGMTSFDLQFLKSLGFHRFKLLWAKPGLLTAH